MKVIAVENYKKCKYRIYLEDKGNFVLYAKEVSKYHIKEGMELTEEEYETILMEVLHPRAKRRALHLLEKMDRTEKDLQIKLKDSGYPLESIEVAVEYVKKFHYIDDVRYTKNYVSSYQNRKTKTVIQQELLQKGIHKEIIEQAIAENYEADDLEKMEKILLKKNFNRETASLKERQRIYNHFMRKGFSALDINKVLKVFDY